MVFFKRRCPYCGSTDVVIDKVNNALICNSCGKASRLESLSGRLKKGGGKVVESVETAGIGKIFCALISLLIVAQAFQPLISFAGGNIIKLAVACVIIGVVTLIISLFFAGFLFGGLGIALIILGIVILAIGFSPSPELLKTVRIAWSLTSTRLATATTGPASALAPVLASTSGTVVAYASLFAIAIIVLIMSFKLKSPLCYIFPFFVWGVLFLGVKPILAITGITKYTSIERSVNVQYTVPYKTIPVSGGVSIVYGTNETKYTPATLLAGEPYTYYYTLQNLYEEDEKFKLDPFIEIRYQYATVRFRAPQEPRAPYAEPLTLRNKSFYEDKIYYDPATMIIETEDACYYTTAQMKSYYGKDFKPVCSFDNRTCGEKEICAKVGDYLCDCLGWTGLTCGGYKAYMGMNVWHTGFLRATGTLFYKEKFFEPIANKRTEQGPFAITPKFFPNPWVEALYNPKEGRTEYYTDIKLGVELENSGAGEIKINSMNVAPVNTEINTTVKGYSEELGDILEVTVKENLGINLLGCDFSEIIGRKIPSGDRIFKEICRFSKPALNVSVIDIKAGKVRITQELKIEDVYSYCKARLESLNMSNVSEEERKTLLEVNKLIGRTGLCEILSEEASPFAKEWREKIENGLKSVDVIFEINYERSFAYPSRAIAIDTNTRECLSYSTIMK